MCDLTETEQKFRPKIIGEGELQEPNCSGIIMPLFSVCFMHMCVCVEERESMTNDFHLYHSAELIPLVFLISGNHRPLLILQYFSTL